MAAAACQAPGTLQTCLELATLATAPGCARGHVRSVATEWGLAGLAATAELLVSELVTNAVRACEHLRARADVPAVPVTCVWLTSDGLSLMINVWDPSDEMPVRRNSGFDDEIGRGLMLVDHLAKDWGAYRGETGKVVWRPAPDMPACPTPDQLCEECTAGLARARAYLALGHAFGLEPFSSPPAGRA